MASSEEVEAAPSDFGRLVRVFALAAVRGLSQVDQIVFLRRVGFTPAEIAELIGTTSNTVSVTLSQQRKKAKPNPKAKSNP